MLNVTSQLRRMPVNTTRQVSFQGSVKPRPTETWVTTSGVIKTTEKPALRLHYEAVRVVGNPDERLVLYIDPERATFDLDKNRPVPLRQLLELTSPAALTRQIQTLPAKLPAKEVNSVFYPIRTSRLYQELQELEALQEQQEQKDKPDYHVFDEKWIRAMLAGSDPIKQQYARKYADILQLKAQSQNPLNPPLESLINRGNSSPKVILMTHLYPCRSN
jgi:hypothetical protein